MSTGLSVIPRKAAIITAGGDGGQAEIARALEEPLRNEFGTDPVRLDVNDFLTPTARSVISETYRVVFDTVPRILAGLLGGDRNSEVARAIQEVRSRIDVDALVNALGGSGHPNGPSAALCLHPVAAAALGELRRRGRALYPIWGVIGDFYVNPLWIDSAIDRYAVAHEDIAESLRAAGIEDRQVVVTGIPVKELTPQKTAPEARASLGLDQDMPVLLILAKGQEEDVLDRILFQLSLMHRPASFLFGTGSDRRAAEALRTRAPRYGVRAKMFGETSTLGPILDASDLLIGPARGSVAARALTRGIPLFTVSPDAQETQNLEFLLRHNAGVRVDNVLQLAAELDLWLTRSPQESHARIRALGRPDAPERLTREALASARETDRILAEAREREEKITRRGVPLEAGRPLPPPAREPGAPGFFEEIGDLPASPPPSAGRSTRGLQDALAAAIYAERQAIAREEEARAAAAKWERRREMALRRGEAGMAAEAALQADRARAEMARARKDREAAARQRASLAPKPSPEQRIEHLEQRFQAEEKNWRSLELEEELEALKRRMTPRRRPDEDKGPAR